jgi:hypothetical protein
MALRWAAYRPTALLLNQERPQSDMARAVVGRELLVSRASLGGWWSGAASAPSWVGSAGVFEIAPHTLPSMGDGPCYT